MSNPQNPCSLTVKAISMIFGAHAVLVFAQDEIGRYSLRHFECAKEIFVKGQRLDQGQGLAGWILKNRQSVIVNDFNTSQSHIGYYSDTRFEQGLTAFMGCCFDTGILCVDTKRGNFNDQDLDLLHLFAGIISSQLDDAKKEAEDDARTYFTHFERIQELRNTNPKWQNYLPQFLELLAKTTNFDHVSFATVADQNSTNFNIEAESSLLLLDEGMPKTMPLSGALTGWVFRNQVPVHTEGLDGSLTAPLYGKFKNIPQFQAVICLPIKINNSTTAVLCFGSVEPQHIPQVMRSYVRMAADELVKFLENLYLRYSLNSMKSKAKT